MITKVIKLDINKNLYEKIKAKQGDTKSRFLLFQLLDGSMPFNLENRSVRAYMLKPDSTEVFNDLIINNRNTGHCTLELTNQVLAVAGIVKIELMIIENDKKITSSIFELQVDKSINSENSIVSTNEFNALLNGLASLSEYDNYKEKAKKVPELEENIQELGSQLEHKAKQSDLKTLENRMNNFTALPEGSTTGDAELIDARVGSDGGICVNVGENIRSVGSIVNDNIITKKVVNDIEYSTGDFVASNGSIYASTTIAPYYYGSTRSFQIEGMVSIYSDTNQIWIGLEIDTTIFIGANLINPSIRKVENGVATSFTDLTTETLLPVTEYKAYNFIAKIDGRTLTISLDGEMKQKFTLPDTYNILGIAFLNLGLSNGKLTNVKTFNEVLENRFKSIENRMDNLINTQETRFKNMTWNVLGDSFTARNKYQYYVQEVLGVGTVNSYGISGSCIANSTSPKNPMCLRYSNMKSDADIITVWGGVNDYGKAWGSNGGIELGTESDTTDMTFYGALKILIEGLITKYPSSKIGFIIPTFVNDSDTTLTYKDGLKANSLGYYLEDYRTAIRTMCEKYSIPYLDLGKYGGLNQLNIKLLSEDGLHPNTDGFHFLKYKIAEFIKSL